MRWRRDVVADRRSGIRSVRSLLTATMRAMDVGTIEDQIGILDSAISSDVIAGTAIVTATVTATGNADAAIATAIGTIDAGDVSSKPLRHPQITPIKSV